MTTSTPTPVTGDDIRVLGALDEIDARLFLLRAGVSEPTTQNGYLLHDIEIIERAVSVIRLATREAAHA